MWLSVLHSVGCEEALCKLIETPMKGLMESEASHGKNGEVWLFRAKGGKRFNSFPSQAIHLEVQ